MASRVIDLQGEDVVNRVLEHDRPGRSFVAVDGSRWGELILGSHPGVTLLNLLSTPVHERAR